MVQTESVVVDTPRALEGIRVLDFTWVRAGPWGTRWLGGLGAEVIKVEWPTNERGRGGGFGTPEGLPVNLNTNGFFNDTNCNKKSITLNVRTDRGMELIRRLVSISDVVVENFSTGTLQSWGLDYDELRRLKPDIVYVAMPAFGQTGRHRHYTSFGPSAQALSGLTYLSGLPDEQPAGWGWSYMDDTGGMYVAMHVLIALYNRDMTGKSQQVDTSQIITGIPLNGSALLDVTVNGRPSRREGYPPGNRAHWPGTPLVHSYRGSTAAPHNAYRTKPEGYNDWGVIACFSDDEWRRLVGVMGTPSWATDPKFTSLMGRLTHQDELDEGIEAWTKTLGKYEIMDLCQANGVQAMPVQSNEDRVENDPQLRYRETYLPLGHSALGSYKLQNAPFKLSETPALNYAPSPLLGQHNREVFEGLLGLKHEEYLSGIQEGVFWPQNFSMDPYPYIPEGLDNGGFESLGERSIVAQESESVERTPSEPLTGLRVLELADEKGQWCGKLLADLGADVVKIEPPGGAHTRAVGPFYGDVPDGNRSLSFWHYNTSKRGITLNLESGDGRALFCRLAKDADVILETFRPGYMDSLGIGYEELKKDNPGLVMCSLTSFGQAGPWRDYLAGDLLHLAAGGQMASCGYDEKDVANAPPIAPGGGNAWHIGSHFALIGIMAALNFRTSTGKGQYVDASVHEACALTTEPAVPIYIYQGQVVHRQTGRHAMPPGSPLSQQSQFRCKDGKYINALITLGFTPQTFRILAEWMEGHGLSEDLLEETYQDAATIQENMPHIMDVLVRFIANLTQDEAYHGAQERGFPWGAIRAPDELISDPHLSDREFWSDVEHPELGLSFVYPGHAAIYNGVPTRILHRAPLTGEHNEEIICGELGLSLAEMAVLAEGGIV